MLFNKNFNVKGRLPSYKFFIREASKSLLTTQAVDTAVAGMFRLHA